MAAFAMALPLCALALTACQTEEPTEIPTAQLQRVPGYPDHPANPYDAAGQLYSTLTERFILSGATVATGDDAVAITEAIAAAEPDFLAVKPSGYVRPSGTRVAYIAVNQVAAAHEIISTAGLTPKAELSLAAFVDTLTGYPASTDYAVLYDYIIRYEVAVLADPMVTAYDRKVLLTTASIARHGYHLKKKKRPRDRDWDISWGNITAGTEGSTEDTAKAVVMAVATGMLINR